MTIKTEPKLFLLAFAALLCFVFGTNAQDKKAGMQSPVKTEVCKSNAVSFHCPKGLNILSKGETNGVWVLQNKNKNQDYGVFVVAPQANFDQAELLNGVKKAITSKLFPKESQNYRWNEAEALWWDNSESKFQKAKNAEVGYNNKHSVLFLYHHILFDEKNVFVGYAFELGRGSTAKKQYEEGLGGGYDRACQDLVEIVFSITGEKLPDGVSPCTLTLITGKLEYFRK